ncbi:hypothetical protein WJX73_010240 [Symbiochloris irregularis]|uniref:Ribonuclease H n=1 Tax=Symbiochloris irregularis TaxID=706552 RepID=A0AAW1PGF5_9CHLO
MPITSLFAFSGKHRGTCALTKTSPVGRLFVSRQVVSLAGKWYAVKVGRKPGVYRTWGDCEKQVARYPRAVHKSFSTLQEAEEFAEVSGHTSKRPRQDADKTARDAVPPKTIDDKDSRKTTRPSELFKLMFDGGSRGNPGPAGAGAVLYEPSGAEVGRVCVGCGRATNNVAEYTGLVKGMQAAQQYGVRHLHVQGDSELIIKQMKGSYRVQNEGLKPLYKEAKEVSKLFESLKFEHVYRELNTVADFLSNEAMDGKSWEGMLFLEDSKDDEPATKKARAEPEV